MIAIVGSRDYPRLELVTAMVRELNRENPSFVLVTGGARGVDNAAEEEATRLGHRVISFRPRRAGSGYVIDTVTMRPGEDWEVEKAAYDGYVTFAQAAFHRNELIVRFANKVIAYWDGRSRGTAHAIGQAEKLHKHLLVFGPDGARI